MSPFVYLPIKSAGHRSPQTFMKSYGREESFLLVVLEIYFNKQITAVRSKFVEHR